MSALETYRGFAIYTAMIELGKDYDNKPILRRIYYTFHNNMMQPASLQDRMNPDGVKTYIDKMLGNEPTTEPTQPQVGTVTPQGFDLGTIAPIIILIVVVLFLLFIAKKGKRRR